MTKEEKIEQLAQSAMIKMLERTDIQLTYIAKNAYVIAIAMLEEQQKFEEQYAKEKQRKLSDLHSLNLDLRAFHCLMAEEIYTVQQLLKFTEQQLLRVPNLGRKSLNRLKEQLALQGLALAK